MKTDRITFTGALGDTLAARLDRPEGSLRAAALLAHCGAAVRFHRAGPFRGRICQYQLFVECGRSVGRCGLDDSARHGAATADRTFTGQGGGAEGRAAGAELARGCQHRGPRGPCPFGAIFCGKLDEIRTQGEAIVSLGGRDLTIRRLFLDDISAASLADALPRLGAALLVLHAPRDSVVGIDNARSIFVAARHPKSFVSLDDADHLLTREADAEYAADRISAWSSRYLDLSPEPTRADASEGVVRVAEAEASGFRQDITVNNRHQLVADELEAMGGGNPATAHRGDA
ncbi:hypothetical protein [Roseovarius sp. MS2]|uniref:hypothetical protein n=1 Tax=Roseovarius sp. MS2 TaxID=3390728 RepID=UPI003F5C3D27